MAFRSLKAFVEELERAGELVRIREFVSPVLEITEVADRMVKNGGKALLFENTGTQFLLLINAMAGDRRICMALGVKELGDIETELAGLMKEFMGPRAGLMDKLRLLPALAEVASWMPRPVRGRGACQEVVMQKPDLGLLPVMTCWPADGGPFITLPAVHTIDPDSGIRNLGMYRMQVFGPDMTGMHWHLHKGAARHFDRYRELGRRMPVSVTLGGDPVYTYAATAPLPENMDEYLLAGYLRKKKVELVRCLTNELEVPSDVDFVIEGYVDPAEELILEGPFGDHTGFYSLAGYFPRFHVTCITHRRGAIYPSTIVGVPPQEDGWIGKATERIFLTPIRATVAPELTEMHMPVEGVFHNIVLSSIRKQYPGQASKIMSALWGAGQMMFNKVMVVTDPGVSLTDYVAVARAVSSQADPLTDIHFLRGPVDILDHSSRSYAYGSKMGIDATVKLPGEEQPEETPGQMEPDRPASPTTLPPGVAGINDTLRQQGIAIVLVAVSKTSLTPVREMAGRLAQEGFLAGARYVVFVDDVVDIYSPGTVTWIAANNIDPLRDCFTVDREPGVPFRMLMVDATRKTAGLDGFSRDWPNVTVMDDETILKVNVKWPSLGIGPLLASPSDTYKLLNANSGAISRPTRE